jgi:hypothetical protein
MTFNEWKKEFEAAMEPNNCGATAPDFFLQIMFKAGIAPLQAIQVFLKVQEAYGFDGRSEEVPQDDSLPIKTGTRVVKTATSQEDLVPAGTKGVVLGGKRYDEMHAIYFVQWEGQEILNGVVIDRVKEIIE